MPNFVMIDAPNFVLRGGPHVADDPDEPQYLNPAFALLVGLLGVRRSFTPPTAVVRYDDPAAALMRRIVLHYGFELPPLTAAELFGLLAYCDELDALSGANVFPASEQAGWQHLSIELLSATHLPCRRAAELYSRGDIAGLRSLHREQGTMAALGRRYRDSFEDGHAP
jgi:hypothetical protein